MSVQQFAFEPQTQRYRIISGRGRGRFISENEVRAIAEATRDRAIGEINRAVEQLARNEITIAEWESVMMENVKTASIQQYLLGHPLRMLPEDYGRLGARLRFQYRKLHEFGDALERAELSIAQFRRRSQQYINKTRGLYELGREEAHRKSGFVWEKRIRTKDESCKPCIHYALMNWQPLGTLPAPTEECDCFSECGCKKIYKRE